MDTARKLYAYMLQKGWVDLQHVRSVMCRYIDDDTERYTAWLHEVLVEGLTTDRPKYAFRCCCLAAAYIERLPSGGGVTCCDAYRELQRRVEGTLDGRAA